MSSTAVIPTTGEVLDLTAASPADLADALDTVSDLLNRTYEFQRAVVNEIARRADARGRRSVTIGGVDFEVNAPSEDVYNLDTLRENLLALVAEGKIDAALVDEVIVTPEPKEPEPRVDRRRVNALLKSDDRALLAAITSARTRVSTKRTAKVTGRAVETTATEEPSA